MNNFIITSLSLFKFLIRDKAYSILFTYVSWRFLYNSDWIDYSNTSDSYNYYSSYETEFFNKKQKGDD